MRPDLRRLLGWWGLALALAAAAPIGPAPGAFAGLAVGLAVGSVYVWLLARRMRAVAAMSPLRAVVAAQVGGVARLTFVLLAFVVAGRLWPAVGLGLGWGALAFFAPVVTWMVRLMREVNG